MDRCLSMREVNHVMPSIEFINFSSGKSKSLDLTNTNEQEIKDAMVDTWRDRSDALGDELDGVFE